MLGTANLESKTSQCAGRSRAPGFDERGCEGVRAVLRVEFVADDEMGLGGKRGKGRALKMRRDREKRKKRKGKGKWEGKNDGQRETEVRIELWPMWWVKLEYYQQVVK